MGLIDHILGFAADGRKRRRSTPEELKFFSEKATREESMLIDAARMLAFQKQDKKCARCGAPVTEEGSELRLVSSERGLDPNNAILVCSGCDKLLDEGK